MIDLGFDLAGRSDKRLWQGAMLSSLGAVAEATPLLVAYVALDRIFAHEFSWSWIPWIVGALLGSTTLTAFLKARGGMDSFVAAYGLVCDSRLRLVNHLRRLPMGFWTAQRTGAISSTITDEFALYTEIATHVWALVVSHITKPLTIALILLVADWRMGLVAIVLFPLAFLSVPWSHQLLNRASDRLASTKENAHARLVETTQGIATLREYKGAHIFQRRLEEALNDLESEQMKTELAPAPALLAYKLTVWLNFCILVAVGVYGVTHQYIAPTLLLLALLLALQLYASASELSDHLVMARFATRTLERIRVLLQEPTQTESDSPQTPADASVEIDGVSFQYKNREVIKNVSAAIPHGTVTALVGPSGSGKSTLGRLLTRLWDIDEGSIQIGGCDVRDLALSDLRKQVAAVLQDVVLFEETVEDNIRLGRPDASREEVIKAAKAAQAHDFIMELPDGYDTTLLENGDNLSGGQRQRISIARALLLDAPILLLDEATSSVDSHNELLIQRALRTLTRGRTVIVIAHRLWTVQHADQILVLDKGSVVERGNHETLMNAQGLYRKLWDIQQNNRSWKIGDEGTS